MAAAKTNYQGGPFVDILSGQGKSPLEEFKITPPTAVQKVFDKAVKGYVFVFSGGAVAKMQLPNDEKKSLNLVQPFIVFQVLVSQTQPFSLEFGISDATKNKRRIHLSFAFNKPDSTPLHARIPLASVQRGVWMNLCFDLVSLVNNNFKGQSFRSLDLIVIHPACTIRRIFTLRSPPFDTTGEAVSGICSDAPEQIPHTHEIPPDIGGITHLFTMERVFEHLQILQQQQPQEPPSPPLAHDPTKAVPLAFGRRVPSAKGSPHNSPPGTTSPPQTHYQQYPSSPQTPNTRLAAKAKAAVTKPNISAVTKPISGKMPKVSSGPPKSSQERQRKPSGGELGVPAPDHRNITPIPQNARLPARFSEVPPRSASPEIPHNDEEDDGDYADGSNYGSDEEDFPVQNFDGISLQQNNKEYSSSRYQADRAATLNPTHGFTSHINTKPVNKEEHFTASAWASPTATPNVMPNGRNKRYSAELTRDDSFITPRIDTQQEEALPPAPAQVNINARRPATNVTPRSRQEYVEDVPRPRTTGRKDTIEPEREANGLKSRGSTARPPTSTRKEIADERPRTTTRSALSPREIETPKSRSANTTPRDTETPKGHSTSTTPRDSERPRTTTRGALSPSDTDIPRTQSSGTTPRDTKTPQTSMKGVRSSSAGSRKLEPPGPRAATGAGTRRVTTADPYSKAESTRMYKSNSTSGVPRMNTADMKKSTMDTLFKTAEESGLHKSNSKYDRNNYKDDDDEDEDSKYNRRNEKRNSMENVYNRLAAESDVTGLRSRGSEDEEDEMCTGEDDNAQESGYNNRNARESIEVDKSVESIGEDDDEHLEEGEEEDEEIDEDIEEGEGEYLDNRDDVDNDEVEEDFQVCTTGGGGDGDESGDEEGQLVYDSKQNAYFDAKTNKYVHMH